MRLPATVVASLVLAGCSSLRGPTAINGRNADEIRVANRLEHSTEIYRALLTASDGGIPESLLARSSCVAVMPEVLKGAFLVGGRFGRGIVTCRDDNGKWSAPAFIKISAASIGFQIGAEATDLVLFFVGDKARDSLLTSNITLGGDITVAAGPVGRSAEGKHDLIATGIYSYARSKGIFAGLSLEGAILKPDADANRVYYGKPMPNRHILFAKEDLPLSPEATEFLGTLPGQRSVVN